MKILVMVSCLLLTRPGWSSPAPDAVFDAAQGSARALSLRARYLGLTMELSEIGGKFQKMIQEILQHARNCREGDQYACKAWIRAQPLYQLALESIKTIEPWSKQAWSRLRYDSQAIAEEEVERLQERAELARQMYAKAEESR